MHIFFKVIVAGMLSTLIVPASATKAPTDVDAQVKRAATTFMRENGIPGLAIAVTIHGKAHFYNFGVASRASGQAVSSDTLFELGSISKTFNASLAAYTQVSGKLSLDQRVATYLPELSGTPFGDISLIQLGTHTGGGFPLQVPDDITNDVLLMTWLKAWKPHYPAGTKRSYANPSIGMLGRIAANAWDKSYAQVMDGMLFPKLGLARTYVRVPEEAMDTYAQGYNSKDEPVRLNPGVLADEAYGVKSSARDMLRFVEANLGEVELEPSLKHALVATRTGYYKTDVMTQDLAWEQYAWPVSLNDLLKGNSAAMVYETQPVTALQPPLAPRDDVLINKTGATGGFGGYVAFVPAEKLGIVILANRNHATEARVRLAYRVLALFNAGL